MYPQLVHKLLLTESMCNDRKSDARHHTVVANGAYNPIKCKILCNPRTDRQGQAESLGMITGDDDARLQLSRAIQGSNHQPAGWWFAHHQPAGWWLANHQPLVVCKQPASWLVVCKQPTSWLVVYKPPTMERKSHLGRLSGTWSPKGNC